LQTNIKIQEFDKEDEKWWDGAWTSEMQIACSNLLRKIRRNRISGIFLSPVDPNESRRTLDFFEFISMHACNARFGINAKVEYILNPQSSTLNA